MPDVVEQNSHDQARNHRVFAQLRKRANGIGTAPVEGSTVFWVERLI